MISANVQPAAAISAHVFINGRWVSIAQTKQNKTKQNKKDPNKRPLKLEPLLYSERKWLNSTIGLQQFNLISRAGMIYANRPS